MIKSFTKGDSKGDSNGHASGTVESKSSGVTDESISGVRRIAINVLGAAGYGKPRSWNTDEEPTPPGHEMSFMDSLFKIISQLIASCFLPPSLLLLPIFPKSVRQVGQACVEFPIHTVEMIAKERSMADRAGHSLMSVMIQVSDQEKKSVGSKLYLTEEELTGNLFQFTLAGFDTTSNTMAYALTCMAIYPAWQDWVVEEIAAVAKSDDLDYESTFPKLKRCLALMVRILITFIRH